MNRKKIKKPYPDEQKISEITLIGAITDNYTYQNQFHQYKPVDLFPNDIGFFFFYILNFCIILPVLSESRGLWHKIIKPKKMQPSSRNCKKEK